jgi:hypothetical protein
LGASIASVGGLSLKANFPNVTVKMYTFGGIVRLAVLSNPLKSLRQGQPRTGNSGYATLVEEMLGISNIFRGKTHSWSYEISMKLNRCRSRSYIRCVLHSVGV